MDTSVIIANNYWHVLKDLSNDAKLELIARLSNSLLPTKKKVKTSSASSFYGMWKDDDSLDADCLNEEIKASRRFKDDIEAF